MKLNIYINELDIDKRIIPLFKGPIEEKLLLQQNNNNSINDSSSRVQHISQNVEKLPSNLINLANINTAAAAPKDSYNIQNNKEDLKFNSTFSLNNSNNTLEILTNKVKQYNILLNKSNNKLNNTFDFLLFLKKDEFYNLKLQFFYLISLLFTIKPPFIIINKYIIFYLKNYL